jgi:hypothetical protein
MKDLSDNATPLRMLTGSEKKVLIRWLNAPSTTDESRGLAPDAMQRLSLVHLR